MYYDINNKNNNNTNLKENHEDEDYIQFFIAGSVGMGNTSPGFCRKEGCNQQQQHHGCRYTAASQRPPQCLDIQFHPTLPG